MKKTPKDMAVSHGNKSLLKFASSDKKVMCCFLPSVWKYLNVNVLKLGVLTFSFVLL